MGRIAREAWAGQTAPHVAIAVLGVVLRAAVAAAQPAADEVGGAIQAILAAGGPHPTLGAPPFPDHAGDAARAYGAVAYRPLWLRDGSPTAAASAAVDALAAAATRGLSAADYGSETLRAGRARLAAAGASAAEQAAFDTALTLALMRFAAESYNGRVAPDALGLALDSAPKPLDLAALALELSASPQPGRRLDELQPRLPLYGRLVAALAAVRDLQARPDVRAPSLSTTLRPGDRDPSVPELRAFLAALGDLPPPAAAPADPWAYEPGLADAVRRFQGRHNLDADAVVGPATRRELAVPLERRAEQIALALERIRWLPEPRGQRLLIINIPAFRLLAFDDDTGPPRLSMAVIVGSALRRQFTPVLRAEMRYVIFGPYWNVPRSIARGELLPILRRDPGYLARQGMDIVDASGALPPTPNSVALLAEGRARLRQRPGPRNALGRVKFIFPNRSNVYLHDTPAGSLFARSRRDFSHGCIRVADPLALAEFVLSGQPGWDRQRIAAAMREARDQRVDLDAPLPVYLLYSTAVVTPSGELRFFADLYGHDATLGRALAARGAAPSGA